MKKSFKKLFTACTAVVSLALVSVTAFANSGAPAEVASSTAEGNTPSNPLGGIGTMLIMIIPLVLIGYFMIYRPEKKRKKEAQELKDSLKAGDRITTIGGIVGTVEKITDEEIHLTNGLILKRWALRSIDTSPAASATYYEDEEDGEENKDE